MYIESDASERKAYDPNYFDLEKILIEKLREAPIPPDELLRNLFLFVDRRAISRFLFFKEMYEKILDIHGSVVEFGVRYGVNQVILSNLRGVLEPYNHNRKIIGFDTFSGFPEVTEKDKGAKKGQYSVPEAYVDFLKGLMNLHELMSPLPEIKKHKVVKGDILKTLPKYLRENPHTMISFAYFDLDIYKPTIFALNSIEKYLGKGSVIVFDEINVEAWPGETEALREWMGKRNFRIIHSKYKAAAGYLIYE